MSILTAPAQIQRASTGAAYRALWIAIAFDLLAFGVGFSWDRRWHTTHPFESFFSPPHLFIYSMHLLATGTLAYVTLSPAIRAPFGATFRLRPLPFAVPGPIVLAGSGFAIIALAGVFDGIWHTAFGLDETGWSFPHAMLGSGIFVAFVGLASCRWALREARPIGAGSELVFGFLLLATAGERFTGPIGTNLSPAVIEYVRNIPVLATEPAFQHTARIELAFQLDRLNRLYVPLQSLSAGMALALLRSFATRTWAVVALTALATYSTRLVPFVVPGLVVAAGSRLRAWLRWSLAGVAFALVTALVWRGTPGGFLLGVVLFAVGVWLGGLVWSVAARPTRTGTLVFAVLAGLIYPALTGVVDLALRARVP